VDQEVTMRRDEEKRPTDRFNLNLVKVPSTILLKRKGSLKAKHNSFPGEEEEVFEFKDERCQSFILSPSQLQVGRRFPLVN